MQELTFHRDFDNDFDRFAVAGETPLPGKLAPPTMEHVPRQLSRYNWYALRYGIYHGIIICLFNLSNISFARNKLLLT